MFFLISLLALFGKYEITSFDHIQNHVMRVKKRSLEMKKGVFLSVTCKKVHVIGITRNALIRRLQDFSEKDRFFGSQL